MHHELNHRFAGRIILAYLSLTTPLQCRRGQLLQPSIIAKSASMNGEPAPYVYLIPSFELPENTNNDIQPRYFLHICLIIYTELLH